MSVIFIALPVAIVLAAAALGAFAWAVRQGQYDDVDTPSVRMLFDDELPASPPPASPDAHSATDGRRGRPAG